MKKLITLLFAGMIGVSTFSGMMPQIHASEGALDTMIELGDNTNSLSQNEINKFDKYVYLDTAINQFKVVEAAKTDLSSKDYEELNIQIAQTNNFASEITLNSNEKMTVQDNCISIVKQKVGPSLRYREGKTAVKLYWWGVRIWISKSDMPAFGGGVSIIGLWIPEPVVSKLIATAGIVAGFAPGGIVFNSTPPIVGFWGFEWQ